MINATVTWVNMAILLADFVTVTLAMPLWGHFRLWPISYMELSMKGSNAFWYFLLSWLHELFIVLRNCVTSQSHLSPGHIVVAPQHLITGDFNDCWVSDLRDLSPVMWNGHLHLWISHLSFFLTDFPDRTSCPDTGDPTLVSNPTSVKCVRRNLPAVTTCQNMSKSTVFHASAAQFTP